MFRIILCGPRGQHYVTKFKLSRNLTGWLPNVTPDLRHHIFNQTSLFGSSYIIKPQTGYFRGDLEPRGFTASL